MKRVYNFSAGPAVLPEEVLREAAEEMLDYNGTGMSVMEMSHRSKAFEEIIQTAEQDLRDLMHIPDNYTVLFLQGGASQQFSAIPMNLMKNGVACYVETGAWSKKAIAEAKRYGEVKIVASSADKNFSYLPDCSDLDIPDNADYVYICENETINGTAYHTLPNTKGKVLVADQSSLFLSRPCDVSKYGLIWAGVQKNVGPAGMSIVIIREDLIREDLPEFVPTYLRYKTHADADSLYNTPNCYCIYMCGKVFKWLKKMGGLEEMKKRRQEKVRTLQDMAGGYLTPDTTDGLKPEEDVPKADAIRESREKQRQISRQITSFYQEPKESPRVDELERQVKELNEKLEREQKGQDPLELMEKSYEMAARYFPGQTGGQVKNIQPAGGSSGNPAAIAAGRATENVVSSLAVPPVPDTIPRNYGFATAVGGGQLAGANTIRACVAEDQTVTTGA